MKNKWIFSLPSNTSIEIICNGSIISVELSGNGFINIFNHCIISTNEVQLVVYDFKSNNITYDVHVGYFIAGGWEGQHLLETEFIHNNLSEIRTAINKLNEIKPFHEFTAAQYSTIGMAITISVVMTALFFIFIYCKCLKVKIIDHSFILRDLENVRNKEIQNNTKE